MKKALSLVICMVLLLGTLCPFAEVLPTSLTAYAADSGSCGDSVSWSLDGNTLTISGIGEMSDYSSSNVPWYSSRSLITTVVIENGVTSVGRYAFYDCTNLESVTIPSSVTSIGDGAFYKCSSLASVTIPSGVTSIGDYAFRECTSLASITIPSGVTSIGDWAFYNCSKISKVNYTGTVSKWCEITFDHYYSNPTYYAGDLYINDVLLTNVNISNSVNNINAYAFYNCKSITSITIPDSVTSIGSYVFYNCVGLKNVSIGKGIKYLSGCTFYGCKSLTSVTLPSSVKFIDNNCFYESGLKTIIMPGVQAVDEYCFRYCPLEKIYITTDFMYYSAEAFPSRWFEVYYSGSRTDRNLIICGPEGLYEQNNYLNRAAWHYNEKIPGSSIDDDDDTDIDPLANLYAKLKLALSKTVDYKTKVKLKATATGVDEGYHLRLFIGNKTYDGSRTEVVADLGSVTSDVSYSVSVVKDSDNTVQENLTENGTVTCNSGFFAKLIAFFKGLFGALPSTTIEP